MLQWHHSQKGFQVSGFGVINQGIMLCWGQHYCRHDQGEHIVNCSISHYSAHGRWDAFPMLYAKQNSDPPHRVGLCTSFQWTALFLSQSSPVRLVAIMQVGLQKLGQYMLLWVPCWESCSCYYLCKLALTYNGPCVGPRGMMMCVLVFFWKNVWNPLLRVISQYYYELLSWGTISRGIHLSLVHILCNLNLSIFHLVDDPSVGDYKEGWNVST
jgi:hypothetical protein